MCQHAAAQQWRRLFAMIYKGYFSEKEIRYEIFNEKAGNRPLFR